MAFLDTYRGYVPLWECDEMGHMNVQFYVAKSSDASYAMKAALGLGPATFAQTTFVALEHHIRFHRELRTSDLVAMRSGIVRIGEKTLTLYQELCEILSDSVAATITAEVGHMDLRSRKLVPWLAPAQEKAAALHVELPEMARPRVMTAEALDRGISLARADEAGMIVSIRNAVNTPECDTNGHMNARFYMARFSDAQGHFWAHIGIPRHEQAARGLATATTEYRIAYLRELRAGETVIVRTGLAGLTDKTVRMRHWMFEAETGAPACIAEGIALLMDKTARRAVPIPPDVRPAMERALIRAA